MSCSQFLDQVQILLHTQQVRLSEINYGKSNYCWLHNKKFVLTYLSAREEFLIRQAVQKINEEQRMKVIKQLLSWMEEHPFVQVRKIPEMCILFLNRIDAANVINEVTLSRKSSFRNSLRRLSVVSNKIAPAPATAAPQEHRRCVKFNDQPTVYCISD